MGPNPSGRIQVTTYPQALPATCAVCGKGAGGRVGGKEMEFADFGLSFEFYGAFYLCTECVFELAHTFFCLDPITSKLIMEEKELLKDENTELKKQIKELKDVLGNSLLNWIGTSNTTNSSGSSGTVTKNSAA